jgi:DNA-binding NtrC family response regulator
MMSLATSESFAVPASQEDENSVSFDAGLTLREIEKAVILETLKRQNFNRTRAARVLGIGIRTLQRKIKQYRAEATTVSFDA